MGVREEDVRTMKNPSSGNRRRFVARALACTGVLLAAAPAAKAVIIYGGTGINAPANTTAPVGYEDAWARVGSAGNGTGVYLGNGFVLTAAHVSINSQLVVDGVTYNAIGNSTILKNPNNSDTDLRLYRIAVGNTTPLFNVDPIAIAPTSLATNSVNKTEGVLIGTGVGQVELQPVAIPALSNAQGFTWAGSGTRAKRWAEAEIGSPTNIAAINGRTIDEAFSSQFKFFEGLDGAGALNDSGSPLFYLDGGVPTLAGLVHTVTRVDYTRVNDSTFFSDLAEYADQLIITPGDLDGDGGVGQGDLNLVLSHFGFNVTPGQVYLGDADGDGKVGIKDADFILSLWGNGYDQPIAQAIVPEPTSMLLLAAGALALTTRRRR